MTPGSDPALALRVLSVSVACGLVVAGIVVALVRACLPLIDGWFGRHENGFVAALLQSEDASLPADARQRARELFLANLTLKQRRSWHLRRRFDAIAASGRRYTISGYRPFNVSARDALFCIQIVDRVPVYDKLLAQKLLIESDEQRFLARANVRTFASRWGPLMAAARERYPAGF